MCVCGCVFVSERENVCVRVCDSLSRNHCLVCTMGLGRGLISMTQLAITAERSKHHRNILNAELCYHRNILNAELCYHRNILNAELCYKHHRMLNASP